MRNCKTLDFFYVFFSFFRHVWHVSSESVELGPSKTVSMSHFEFKARESARNRCHVLRSGPNQFPQHDDGFPARVAMLNSLQAWVKRQWRLICNWFAIDLQLICKRFWKFWPFCVLVEQLCVVLCKCLVDDICLALSPELILIWSTFQPVALWSRSLCRSIDFSRQTHPEYPELSGLSELSELLVHDFAMVIRDGTLGNPKRPPAIASELHEMCRETMRNGLAVASGLPMVAFFSYCHINHQPSSTIH